MDTSLSILLPVYNAENRLVRQISQLLEILPDLTPFFEILVIDDGSTDLTEEVAADLVREYPQVRYTRNAEHLGKDAATQKGMAETASEIVLVQDDHYEIRSGDMTRLWALRNDDTVVIAQAEPPAEASLMDRLTAWGTALRESVRKNEGGGGIQMIRREAMNGADSPSRITLSRMTTKKEQRATTFVTHLSELAGK